MNLETVKIRPGAAAASVLVLVLAQAFAMEPPTKEQLARYRQDGTLAARAAQARSFGNHRVSPRLASRTREKLMRLAADVPGRTGGIRQPVRVLAPPPNWSGMPTSGTVRVLALLIAFNDNPGTTPPATFASRLFNDGQGGPPFDSLRNFYRRSSYNQLEIQGNVLGWYTAPYARSAVAETDTGRQNVIKEALTYYDQQGHDFTQYDNDGDGAIDYFCVFWAGPHGDWASFWWGYYTGFYDGSYRLDGKRLSNYSWQWELYGYPSGNFSPSTIIHETGHALGVPDYYDYDDSVGPRGGVGGLDIMDGTAGDHNCFSKFMLDWISPTVVAGGRQTVSLRASGLYPDAAVFMPGAVSGRIFDEYFMVQNRYRSGNDTGLFTGGDGLLLWHVDARLNGSSRDFLYDNSYTAHKLLRLMEQDGYEQIEQGYNADISDYYRAAAVFSPATVPNSSRYSGTPTGMGFGNITGTTTPVTVDIFSSDAPPACAFLNLADGQTLYGTVRIDVEASDDTGILEVDLEVSNMTTQADASAPYSFLLDTTATFNGSHAIRAVAYDRVLQTASATVTVTIDNIYPCVNLAGQRVLNRGLLVRESIDVLTWMDNVRNSTDSKFRVYLVSGASRTLLAEVNRDKLAGPYTYLRRNVAAGAEFTYSVVAVGSQDREGDPVSVTVR
jgi:M6 family metalloprotease-like protein